MKRPSLLKTIKECEYPEEFLVARLQGKKGGLFRNWDFLVSGSDAEKTLQDTPFYPYLKRFAAPGIWRFLSNEYFWVYSRMNPSLRSIFEPYFIYHEISTLLKCLRYLVSVLPVELQNSLLHEDLQNILTSGYDFSELLKKIEIFLCRRSKSFSGMSDIHSEKGFHGLESFLLENFLSYVLLIARDQQIRAFFSNIVDFHNCMAAAKNLRWMTEPDRSPISGGTVTPDRYKRAYARKDMSPVFKALHIKGRRGSDISPADIETVMLQSITAKLRQRSYERSSVAIILFYLWEQFRYSRNISMILNTESVNDELVRDRIVA